MTPTADAPATGLPTQQPATLGTAAGSPELKRRKAGEAVRPLLLEFKAAILRAYKNGKGASVYTISRSLGMNPQPVRDFLKELGVFVYSPRYGKERGQHIKPKAATRKRKCITCRKPFDSAHAGNRMCRKCSDRAGHERSSFEG